MTTKTFTPFAKPLYVMLKPAGAACNLACSYCYYLEKEALHAQGKRPDMSDELLERFTQQYLQSQTMPAALFTWHGGEALLRPIEFYKKAIKFQKRYKGGIHVDNCLQTNGTLLTDEWCRFFKENNFLIGISVDGPEHCHNRYRKTKDERPSFSRVMRGINLLKKHGVDFNIMGVVNDYNVDYPLEFYSFFKELDARYIQFAPIVETVAGKAAEWNVPAEKWGDFLIAIFDEWVRKDVGQFFVQYFDATLANWVGEQVGVCTLAKYCGQAGVMEANGDVYSCDHFVFPEYKLGNIHTQTLTELMYSDRQQQFGADKYSMLPKQCKACDYLFACHGECPKNRIGTTSDGEAGLNYLCKGYYRFFKHVTPYMNFMKRELDNHRSPTNIMAAIARNML